MLKQFGMTVVALSFMAGGMSAAEAGNKTPKALNSCKACHFFDKGPEVVKNKQGPGLKGVFGRLVSIPGLPFEVWSAQNLDMWLANPKRIKPDTTMRYKQKKYKKRAKIIEALKQL